MENARRKRKDIQLFNQFQAVQNATPLLLTDNGNTSLGKIQAIGPIETPYDAVNVYIPLIKGKKKVLSD